MLHVEKQHGCTIILFTYIDTDAVTLQTKNVCKKDLVLHSLRAIYKILTEVVINSYTKGLFYVIFCFRFVVK